MSTKKRILFIIPCLAGGGAEKALVNLLSHLDTQKYDIDLLVAERKGIYLDHIPEHIDMYYLFRNHFFRKLIIELHRRFNINWPFKRLTRKVITSKYDVGVCFLDSVFSDILLFLKDKIAKNAVVLHSSYKTNSNKSKFIKGAYKKRLQQRYRQVDTIVGVSREVIDEFTTLLGEYDDMRVINNPISRDDIIKKSRDFDPDFSTDRLNLIAVGSLLPVKGYDRLLRACKLLKESGREFRLRILGKGYLKDQLEAQIQDFGLEEHVLMLGFKNNPYPYVLHSDIFVMSSLAEGLPTVLCEAMILGKPVVVTNCSGCRGLVDHGLYGLMTESTPESLFEGLKEIMDSSEMRLKYSKKAKQRSLKFSVDEAVIKYEEVFNGAVAPERKSAKSVEHV